MKIKWKWRRKLKYIFHDYAKMEMHGLIKKAFTRGSTYGTRSLLSIIEGCRGRRNLLTQPRMKFIAQWTDVDALCGVKKHSAFRGALSDMLSQLKFEKYAL
jgi:hypothetical protein